MLQRGYNAEACYQAIIATNPHLQLAFAYSPDRVKELVETIYKCAGYLCTLCNQRYSDVMQMTLREVIRLSKACEPFVEIRIKSNPFGGA